VPTVVQIYPIKILLQDVSLTPTANFSGKSCSVAKYTQIDRQTDTHTHTHIHTHTYTERNGRYTTMQNILKLQETSSNIYLLDVWILNGKTIKVNYKFLSS
jgi:hypothetical protein